VSDLCTTEDLGLLATTRKLDYENLRIVQNVWREIESHIGKNERPERSLSRLWGVGGGEEIEWEGSPGNLSEKQLVCLLTFPLFSHY